MPHVLRILDANFNRAREALRVMEEAARFILDDAALCEKIKNLRHDLAAQLARIAALENNRDTPGDVGTTIKAPKEMHRESVADVAIAAGKRLSEALRAIEEYGKTLSSDFADFSAHIEQLRYRGYDIEQSLLQKLATGRAQQWKLCVLISEELCKKTSGGWWDVVTAAIAGGADCIQLREKKLDAGELLTRAKKLVEYAHKHSVSVIINDRPDVALLSGADGVHLGQTDLPCIEARRLVGRQLLVGVSTSNITEAKKAQRDGADYCGVGPMFPTTTKHKDVIVGAAYLQQFVTELPNFPHLAIGGISAENLPQLVAAGVRGIAVSSAVCSAADPAAAAQRLRSGLAGTR